MSLITQIGDISALKYLEHQVGIDHTDHLAEVWQHSIFLIFFFPDHFYFPAQLVGGFTLSDLLEKPWSQVGVVPSSPPVGSSYSKLSI